jgi:hypothetical protein
MAWESCTYIYYNSGLWKCHASSSSSQYPQFQSIFLISFCQHWEGQRQGCRMMYHTKNTNFGIFWRPCNGNFCVNWSSFGTYIYLKVVWYIFWSIINYCGFLVVLLSFAMFCGHLVYFSDLGKLYQHTKKNLATLVSDGANQGKSKAKPNVKRAHTHSYISTYVCI